MKVAIERPKYFERIRPFIGKLIIKVLIGQRRVGKSYLLGNLLEIKDNFKKMVVSMDPFQGHSYKGVERYSPTTTSSTKIQQGFPTQLCHSGQTF